MNNKKKTKKFSKGMVDISHKESTHRVAIASGVIKLSPAAFKALLANRSPKGDVLEAAKIAGILAAKKTPELLIYCHPLSLNKVQVEFKPDHKNFSIHIKAQVNCLGRTGVEMEALTAVSVAALTIYDMMKWSGQNMTMSQIQLDYKSGGESGEYKRKA
jgi:cyclic pyranopterin phosphate synthase